MKSTVFFHKMREDCAFLFTGDPFTKTIAYLFKLTYDFSIESGLNASILKVNQRQDGRTIR